MSADPDSDRGLGHHGPATPSGRERRVTLLALATVAAGPLAWMVQLWSLTLASDIPCRALDGPGPLGVSVETWWLVLSAATALVALTSLIVALGIRASRREDSEDEAPDGSGTIHFISDLGVWSSALFLATIALGATAPFFLGCP